MTKKNEFKETGDAIMSEIKSNSKEIERLKKINAKNTILLIENRKARLNSKKSEA